MSATHRIDVLDIDGDAQIWLDTEIAECDGICLGGGNTLAEAKADAIEELEAALAHVQAIDPHAPTQAMAWTDEAKCRRALTYAAPDLLAALQGLLTDGALDVALMDFEAVSIARAAIKKATEDA